MEPFIVLVAILLIYLLLRPRRFYFVRHGETVLNAQKIKQGEAGALSENGRRQADEVGAYLKPYSIRRIISSTYPRARETAEIIQRQVRAPITYSPLFAERKSPSEVIGKPVHDPAVETIIAQTELSYHEDEYRYSDEENFIDLKDRARRALDLLASQGGSSTCIVTHRAFLKMLIAYMLHRERLHAADYVRLAFFNWSDNAGLTICEFRAWEILSPSRGWRVIAYNETP